MKTILPIVVIGTLAAVFGENAAAKKYVADPAATAGPSYYQNLVKKLRPGDTLFLPAGTYNKRLNLNGLQGTAEAWITITGPDTGMAAVITTNSKCCNNVQLGNTAYVALKNLTVDANSEGVNASIDGINAKGGVTHDILIENCVIKGVSRRQSTIGISTKSMARNWIIRGNTIIEAGTGIYLGNSTGAAPFIRGIIEGNLIVDSIGYNLQIKHQNPYSPPREPGAESLRTIIRDNVFLKRIPQSSVPEKKRSGARPNVLVGGFPDMGPGSSDLYEIYGNFFFENKDGESLLQATGRVSIHDNVFVGGSRSAVALMDHNGRLKLAHVYNNTIFGAPAGIRVHNAAQRSRS